MKQTKLSVFERLMSVARNLAWSWDADATRLLAGIDPPLFTATNQNPIRTLRLLTPERRELIEHDAGLEKRLAGVEKQLAAYLGSKTWFDKHGKASGKPLVAYFCMEFAVHESYPQYSGGLGVLAGDHVKAASDLGLPFVGVGLLYRRGFYTQQLNPDGTTRVIYPQLDFADLAITDTGVGIDLPIAGKKVKVKIWKQAVGRVALYFLDTDLPGNSPDDRRLTNHLYGGDSEYRIRQEVLLGIGGVHALAALGLKPTVFHLNEGHAAFAPLERVRQMVERGVEFHKAVEAVRASSVFTTHTPVPAGNDRFDAKMTLKYIGHYAKALGIDNAKLLALGRENATDTKEQFCMTVVALMLARHCNGVSALHGEVSREMWKNVFKLPTGKGVPIGHVTNGIHPQTWLAPEMLGLYDRYLKPNFESDKLEFFRKADRIPDEELWQVRLIMKRKLIDFARRRLYEQALRRGGNPAELMAALTALREDALTIGFARRFATYKRAPLIFRDAERLAKILGHANKPVQILFAGKAHPKDTGGQDFAAQIYKHSLEARFSGRVVLLEDYDMNVGRYLYGGCDVWLNNPLRPQEASGTSGMKPPLHGGLNFSILDGWWPEGIDDLNGWAIGDGTQLADLEKQNAKDAAEIYRTLEKEIVPLFFRRDKSGLPRDWLKRAKHSIASVPPVFSTQRMVAEYWSKFYSKAHAGK
jgi:glycogen phosphorylase